MTRDEVEAAIRDAFAGVRLGSGVSLRQAAAIDDWFEGYTQAQFERLPDDEITDDWSLVPADELGRDNTAHLDPDGLRYYLPALLLWVLDHYDGAPVRMFDPFVDLTVIGTIMWIAPGNESRAHHYQVFDAFSQEQRVAIAAYVEALPGLVHLDAQDTALIERAIRDYWGAYLPAR